MLLKEQIKATGLIVMILVSTVLFAVAQTDTFADSTLPGLQGNANIFLEKGVVCFTTFKESFDKGSKISTHSLYLSNIIPSNCEHRRSKENLQILLICTEYTDTGNQMFVKRKGKNRKVFVSTDGADKPNSNFGSGANVKRETSSKNKLIRDVVINKQRASC